jgi:hypothetical protein
MVKKSDKEKMARAGLRVLGYGMVVIPLLPLVYILWEAISNASFQIQAAIFICVYLGAKFAIEGEK